MPLTEKDVPHTDRFLNHTNSVPEQVRVDADFPYSQIHFSERLSAISKVTIINTAQKLKVIRHVRHKINSPTFVNWKWPHLPQNVMLSWKCPSKTITKKSNNRINKYSNNSAQNVSQQKAPTSKLCDKMLCIQTSRKSTIRDTNVTSPWPYDVTWHWRPLFGPLQNDLIWLINKLTLKTVQRFSTCWSWKYERNESRPKYGAVTWFYQSVTADVSSLGFTV